MQKIPYELLKSLEVSLAGAVGGQLGPMLCERQIPSESGQVDKSVAVHLAASEAQKSQAAKLLNERYSWRGYGAHHKLPTAGTSTTFTASSDGNVVGTITLSVDNPEGLAIDSTFKDEVDSIREVPGANVCELTKFAFDSSASSKQALAALFHVIFLYGSHRYACTDLLIEVIPQHVRFYEVMLGFERIGAPKANPLFPLLPGQLMRLKVADIRQKIDQFAGVPPREGRSLYPHFLPRHEEHDVSARIAAFVEDGAHPACTEAGCRGREIETQLAA